MISKHIYVLENVNQVFSFSYAHLVFLCSFENTPEICTSSLAGGPVICGFLKER